jgi:hypothetical protein
MKRIHFYTLFLLSIVALWGCEKGNYPGGVISPYIAIFDVRDLYKGQDVTLTKDNLFGSTEITGVVVSNHAGKNLPAGLLVVQDARRLSQLRGIALNIGAEAANYVPGDSVIIKVDGGILKRVDGTLQITGVPASAVRKVASGISIVPNRVTSSAILANPNAYESTLAVVVKGGFNPLPAPTDKLAGDRLLNDGFGEITLHTEAGATFADSTLKFLANYYGLVFNTLNANKQLVPQLRPRVPADIVTLSSTITVTPIVITGFMSDVAGGDGNYEYVQLKATQNINFATTPYSLVVTNNANASTPTGYPANGWGTGTSGTVTKGSFFYVGGAGKLINGANSTSMASSNWVRAFNYTTANGDGFGTATGGLFANSGNASGVAVFAGTTVEASTQPVDVIFIATGGSLWSGNIGYRIANTDWYDIKNPITLADQPFYRSGSNTIALSYNTADLGYFNMLGGEYNATLGRWTTARAQNNVLLSKSSPLTEIEGTGATVVR